MDKGKGKWLMTATQIAGLVTAAVAIVIGIITWQINDKANQIAYQSNLPIISAISKIDTSIGEGSEMVVVNNDGGPMVFYMGFPEAIMEVSLTNSDYATYIKLVDYFDHWERTTGTKGVILTCFGKNNRSYYESMASDFEKAASKDGYKLRTSLNIILQASYYDFSNRYWHKCLNITPYGSCERGNDDLRRILESIHKTGLYLNYVHGDGVRLWDWYKNQILMPCLK